MDNHPIDDSAICSDILAGQKQLASAYHKAADESVHPRLRYELMSLEREEQRWVSILQDALKTNEYEAGHSNATKPEHHPSLSRRSV